MDAALQEIKKRIDIVDYIGALVPLKKAGRNFKANCPFHNEKTPSFVVSQDRQLWRCFGGCQDGGDVISFVMKYENITFYEALKELAEQAGVKLDTTQIEDRQWKQKDTLLQINTLAAKYFHYLLTQHESGKIALQYVTNRGLSDKLIETFQLGYAPQSWDSLTKYLTKKGFSETDIETAGLILHSTINKDRYYDRFRGRLMFPIIDARHNILGFSGRLLDKDAKQAKYVNTPETPLYRKRETLYGMHAASEHIRQAKAAIITEGEFDMISCFKHGLSHAVAIKGSAFTKDQLMLLKRHTKHLILALDADFSGTQTTLRAIKDAEEMDFRIDVVHSDLGKDPDEALEKNAVAYKKLFKKPVPLYDFILQTALSRHQPDDPYEKKEIVHDVLPFIREIANPIVKSHYIKRLADLIKTEPRDIESAMRTFSFKEHQKKSPVHKHKEVRADRKEVIQKYILSFIFQSENPLASRDTAIKILDQSHFSVPSYSEIYQLLCTYKGTVLDTKIFFDMLSQPLQSVFDELCMNDISAERDDSDSQKAFIKTLYELKKLSIKDTLKQCLHSTGSEDTVQELMTQLALVEKELAIM